MFGYNQTSALLALYASARCSGLRLKAAGCFSAGLSSRFACSTLASDGQIPPYDVPEQQPRARQDNETESLQATYSGQTHWLPHDFHPSSSYLSQWPSQLPLPSYGGSWPPQFLNTPELPFVFGQQSFVPQQDVAQRVSHAPSSHYGSPRRSPQRLATLTHTSLDTESSPRPRKRRRTSQSLLSPSSERQLQPRASAGEIETSGKVDQAEEQPRQPVYNAPEYPGYVMAPRAQSAAPRTSQQQHHHHYLPTPFRGPQSVEGEGRGQEGAQAVPSGPFNAVGMPGMPNPAPRPKAAKLKFTPEDDALLLELKETKDLTWKQIADFFPGRSSGTLQVRYCTKLKAKNTIWTEELLQRLRSALHDYESNRWRWVASRVGHGLSPAACREKAAEVEGPTAVAAKRGSDDENLTEED